MRRQLSAMVLACLLAVSAAGQALRRVTPGKVLGLLDGGSPAALAGNLRAFVLDGLPTPLFEDARHWGMQKPVRHLKWRGKGLHVHPTIEERPENDGQWWKVKVTATNPRDSLVLDLRDVVKPEDGRLLFTVFVAFDADAQLDRQHWIEGTRLYSGSTRARLRLKASLRCEVTAKLEGGAFLPDAVVRMRVVESKLVYDNLVVEHMAGIGGTAAKLMGEAAHATISQWRPGLERDLLARASAAIVKAADTKEVRLSLGDLMKVVSRQ